MKEIKTIAELVTLFNNAKIRGQFVTAYAAVPMKLLKKSNDGLKEPINPTFAPCKEYHVTFNFGADYEKKVATALGIANYDAHDTNREHLVKGVLMKYLSTDNICLIYMGDAVSDGTTLNGNPMTPADWAYVERFKSLAKSGSNGIVPNYRTVGIKNVHKIVMSGETYLIKL